MNYLKKFETSVNINEKGWFTKIITKARCKNSIKSCRYLERKVLLAVPKVELDIHDNRYILYQLLSYNF